MNKRIKLLAEQAGFIPDNAPGMNSVLEKFAELIVRECLYQVADVRIENDFEPVGDAALVQAMTGIKKYFGVEF